MQIDAVILALIAGPSLIALIALIVAMRARAAPPPAEPDRAVGELAGRLAQLHDTMTATQAQTGDRLDALSRRLGEALHEQAERQATTLGDLKERLATITAAQGKITELSQQVVSLQDVLTNKQARGAFGEVQLEDLVRQALPPSAFEFQATLANNRRADCLLKLPNPPGPIVVDAKFPLESFHALRAAPEGPDRDAARKLFAQAVLKHVRDIAERYILPQETADSALLFLPSEAVYAELHGELPGVVDQSHRARVYIVSPTTLMATLNTMRAVLKDARMREQAHLIQREVRKLNDDVARLDERVGKLQRHFDQAGEDVRQIRVSTEKIARTSERIEALELGEEGAAATPDSLARPAAREAPGPRALSAGGRAAGSGDSR